ncbi:hypothetical protein HN011_007077 [Eciton burchellii]|nr:hypothetical protein HN011_007077 [Eciton burchellii]
MCTTTTTTSRGGCTKTPWWGSGCRPYSPPLEMISVATRSREPQHVTVAPCAVPLSHSASLPSPEVFRSSQHPALNVHVHVVDDPYIRRAGSYIRGGSIVSGVADGDSDPRGASCTFIARVFTPGREARESNVATSRDTSRDTRENTWQRVNTR